MKTYTSKDMEKLHSMNNKEIIATLQEIKNEFLPMDYILEIKDGEIYSESNYNDTRFQIAWRKLLQY
jgi:hypothetical protein